MNEFPHFSKKQSPKAGSILSPFDIKNLSQIEVRETVQGLKPARNSKVRFTPDNLAPEAVVPTTVNYC